MRYDAGFLVRPTRDEFDVGLAVILRTLDPAALRGCSSHDLRTEHKTISKARSNKENSYIMYGQQK